MFDKQFFKGITDQLNQLTDEEKDRRLKAIKKGLEDEMKRRKLKPQKPKK